VAHSLFPPSVRPRAQRLSSTRDARHAQLRVSAPTRRPTCQRARAAPAAPARASRPATDRPDPHVRVISFPGPSSPVPRSPRFLAARGPAPPCARPRPTGRPSRAPPPSRSPALGPDQAQQLGRSAIPAQRQSRPRISLAFRSWHARLGPRIASFKHPTLPLRPTTPHRSCHIPQTLG